MSKEITLITIANQGAEMLNDLLKDSNVVNIVDCPFAIQTFCSHNCDIKSLKHLEVYWEMEHNDMSFPAFKDTILYPAIIQIAYTVKAFGKKYSSITMDTYPDSEVCNCGIASLRVKKWFKMKTKENMLTLNAAFFEMFDD